MKAEDIVDEKTFRAWMDEHEPEKAVAVWLAARAAQRVLPVAWIFAEGTRFVVLRCFALLDVTSVSSISDRATAMAYAARAADAARAAGVAIRPGLNSDTPALHVAAYAATRAAGAAAYAAYAAADTVNVDYSTFDATFYAATGEDAYAEIAADCVDIVRGKVQIGTALWRAGAPRFAEEWAQIAAAERNSAATTGGEAARGATELDWTFWVDWYDDVLAGRPRKLPMMEEIALEVDWDKEPADVLAQIDAIAAKFRAAEQAEQDKSEVVQVDVFRATLFDFSYDTLEGVMRAVPLARDWRHLDDPDLLAAFLQDAEELREDLQLFCDALAAEGAAMQGAGIVRTYCTALLSELQKAETAQSLRVGKLVQYGRMIENARLDPATQKEFGLLGPALEDNGKAVLDLMRNHFARTLSRFAELRDVGIEDDATHWEVLQGFRDLVRAIQSADAPDRPPLAKEDAVVLSDIMESVERQLRAMDSTDDDGVLDSLRREVNFELAKLGATIAIFRERAVGSEKDLGEAADVALKWQKRGLGLWGIVKMLKKGLGIE